MYSVYRNFSRSPRGLTLMDETHGRQLEPDAGEYRNILGGLTLPLYRNTISLRQLQAKTSEELPGLLKNHIVNLRQAGSASLDLKKTKDRLLKEKRALLSAKEKNAEKDAALLELKIREEETFISALPDPAELAPKKKKPPPWAFRSNPTRPNAGRSLARSMTAKTACPAGKAKSAD